MTSPKESLPEAVRKEIDLAPSPPYRADVERIALLAFTEGRRAGLEEAADMVEKIEFIQRDKYTLSVSLDLRLDLGSAIRTLAGGEGKRP